MRTFLATFLLIFCVIAAAEVKVARDGDGTVIEVYNEPCTNAAVIARLDAINPLLLRAGLPILLPEALGKAVVTLEGEKLGACWAQIGQGVLVLDDGGIPDRIFAVPVGEFIDGKEI